MDKLLGDSAKTEISNKVMDILRAYHISNWHSEPYHQNQNPAEWRYRTIKSWTSTVMNRSGAPANCWLLCCIYVCYLLIQLACTTLDGKIPLLAFTGITPDISIILLFTFYQPVFYATYDQHFPSASEERAGYWVGYGEHCGDAMTHKILDQDTQKIIYRSAVRPKKSSTPNHRLAPHGEEVSASSDPSENAISCASPLGAPGSSSPEQKAPTVCITQKIIYRSAVRPKKSSTPNHRLAPHGGEVSASSDPSEDKSSCGSPIGAPGSSSPEQKAPTVFIRSL